MAALWKSAAVWMQFTEDGADHHEHMEEHLGCSEQEHDGGGEEVDTNSDGDSQVPGSNQLSFGTAGRQGGGLQVGEGAFRRVSPMDGARNSFPPGPKQR